MLGEARMIRSAIYRQGIGALTIVGVVILWELVAMLVDNSLLLPSFFDVIDALLAQWQEILLDDLPVSMRHFLTGLGVGLLVAMPIGMCMGWFRMADLIIDPIIEVVRPIPPLAWIPFAIIWFGLTHESAGFIVFVGAVFPILINTYVGLRNVPKVYVESAKVLGCTREIDLIRHVAFPSALPSIAAGFRISMGIAWMCLVAAEMFGVSTSGLGYKIWWYYYIHRMNYVLLYMIVLGLLGLLLDHSFRYFVEDKLLKWRVGLTQ